MERSPNIVPAWPKHIGHLAAHLRPEERAEVWAAGHLTPVAALERSLTVSERAWTAFEPGTETPMAMFGLRLVSALSDEADVWCLTTDAVQRHAIHFARHSRRIVRAMLALAPVLTNYVDARYTGGLAWLRWLGAKFDPPAPWGPDGMFFQRFEIKRGEGGMPPWAQRH